MRFTDIEINPAQYQRMVQYYGDELGDMIEVVPQTESVTAIHYTMVDGSMVLTDDGWKEVKLGRHFTSDDIQKVGSEKRQEISCSTYHAQMVDSDSFIASMDRIIERAVHKGHEHVFLNDGAIWIENWIRENHPDSISILDFWHGEAHVNDAVKIITPEIKEQKKLMAAYKEMMLEGKVLEVAALLEANAKQVGKDIGGILQYLRRNAYRMEYDKYRERGLMIGSGAIEAAHRTVIQSRMKLSGQRWAKAGVDAMLKLRVRYESKRWCEVKNEVFKVNFKCLANAA